MMKKVMLFTLVISILALSGACESVRSVTGELSGPGTSGKEKVNVTPEKVTGIRNYMPDKIIDSDVSYSKYDADIFDADYDGDGETEYFIVFTEKESGNEDDIGCYADIWLGDENGVNRVAEWLYIAPDTYDKIKLAGKYYFRYDLAFATERRTVLLRVNTDNSVDSYNCPGFVIFNGESDEFSVTVSAYDMVYLKGDGYSCGHTWKNYYFFADAEGFHEYGAVEISEEEFLEYPEADSAIEEINSEYAKDGTSATYEFLKRSNSLIHINIACETKDDIAYYFRTYKITADGALVFDESGEGRYISAVSDEAVY